MGKVWLGDWCFLFGFYWWVGGLVTDLVTGLVLRGGGGRHCSPPPPNPPPSELVYEFQFLILYVLHPTRGLNLIKLVSKQRTITEPDSSMFNTLSKMILKHIYCEHEHDMNISLVIWSLSLSCLSNSCTCLSVCNGVQVQCVLCTVLCSQTAGWWCRARARCATWTRCTAAWSARRTWSPSASCRGARSPTSRRDAWCACAAPLPSLAQPLAARAPLCTSFAASASGPY